MTITDKPGKENVVGDFLSRLTLPTDNEDMVDDQLLDENFIAILVLSPWFADIASYLVVGRFPHNLLSKEKSKIVMKSVPFTWIWDNNFILGQNHMLMRCVRE